MRQVNGLVLISAALIAAAPAGAVTNDQTRIIDEGVNRSQRMVNAHELFDDIEPCLTMSSNMRKAQNLGDCQA